ncbi:MAG: HD domain-containing protein [Myxococcota bacterium]
MSPRAFRIAAMDVGTNSVHLLVADIHVDGSRHVVETFREQVGLGSEGLGTHCLTPEAFERGQAAIAKLVDAANALDCDDIHATATSAVREASNGEAFCAEAKRRSGVHIRVISGDDEARLIWAGARDALDYSRGRVMLFDLGGGSTEFALCNVDGLLLTHSIRTGHLRLAESFHTDDPLSASNRQAMKQHVRELLAPMTNRLRPNDIGLLVGTSGCVRTLAKMATLARGEALPEHGEGLILTRKGVDHLLEVFQRTPRDKLSTVPGFDGRRRKTLPAGALLVREILKALGKNQLQTTVQSLRDGIVADWIRRHRPELDLSRTEADPRRRSVLHAMQRFDVHAAHARQVAGLALQLFDGLAAVHGLHPDDRGLLAHAAHLHDIGHHIAGKGHHKHGQYLIRHTRLRGFTAPELSILGNLVRYHSKSTPKTSHSEFSALNSGDRRRVRTLAGLLKIADALDRSHAQHVTSLTVACDAEVCHINVSCTHTPDVERWAVELRKPLLESALKRSLRVEFTRVSA